MKHFTKWLAFFALALALFFALCACGGETETTTGEGRPQTPPVDNDPNTPADACAHQYGEWLVTLQPTCTQKGLHTRACTLCGKSETGYLDALGHDEIEHAAKAPTTTCTKVYWDAYVTCSRCDYSTYVELNGHNEANQDFNCPQCVAKWGQLEFTWYADYNADYYSGSPYGYVVTDIGTFTGTTLKIPTTYHGEPVTSIGLSAFFGCTGLTSITIPSSVTSIGDSAFSNCTALTSILVDADNLVYHSNGNCLIETESKTLLAGCKNSIIPTDGSVTSIGRSAFSDCTGLTSITIPESVTSIGERAFSDCTGLTSITIPESVTSIERNAFSGCTGLTSIVIPESVTSIGDSAFSGCTGLTSIVIPESVMSIEWNAFFDCTGLTSIVIPESVTSIERNAFSGCTGLTSITIPSSVTSIGDWAFLNCTALTSILVDVDNLVYHSNGNCLIATETKTLLAGCKNSIIPTDGSVTCIRDSAFSDCTGLTSITIPSSVTSIERYAFYGCTGLTSITIPESVTSIGEGVFSGCTGLTSIVIPESVASIGERAFSDCTGLTSIYYVGSAAEWAQISIHSSNTELTAATIYYYAPDGAPDTTGNYWHYDEDGNPVAW